MVCIIILFLTLTQLIILYKMLTFTLCVCGEEGGGRLVAFCLESSHRICLIELLLYDNFCATRIKCIVFNVQDYSFYFVYNIAVLAAYVRVDLLLTSWKYLHDRIISLRWMGWAYKSNLTLTLFIEAPVLSHESEWSCICVLDFGVVPTVWYFLFFIFPHLFISNEQQLKMKNSECIKC